MGNGWLVSNIKMVENADEEYLALGSTNLTEIAVVDRRFEEQIGPDLVHNEVQGKVQLTEYKPNYLSYQVSTDKKALAVFSDVYYGESWHASIDGVPVPHLRANYILRALPVEAGTHTVEFEFIFEPFEKGEKISMAGSFLALLILLGGASYSVYLAVTRKPEEEA
jgi:hypothetical protein